MILQRFDKYISVEENSGRKLIARYSESNKSNSKDTVARAVAFVDRVVRVHAHPLI